MSSGSLQRLGAAIIITAAVAVIGFALLQITRMQPAGWVYPGYMVISMLLIFALIAVYAFMLPRASALLHAGFVLSAVSLFLSVGFNYYATFAFPVLKAQFPEAIRPVLSGPMNSALFGAMGIGFIGNISLYIAMLRSGVFPRWAPVMMIIGTLLGLAMLPYDFAGIVTSLGLIGVGRTMLSGGAARLAVQQQPA